MNRVGTVLMFNQVLAFGVAQLDIWIGAAFLEGADLGLYGAAKRALMLVALPLQMAMMVAFPLFLACAPRTERKIWKDFSAVQLPMPLFHR